MIIRALLVAVVLLAPVFLAGCASRYTRYTAPPAAPPEYVGELRDGKANGQGALTWANGDKYVGEFRDDKRSGQGTYYHANGNKYVGGWRDNKEHGQGTLTYAECRSRRSCGPAVRGQYVGGFKDAQLHGQGTYTYADGRKYVGEYRDGKQHGQGTYTYADGRVEEGIWKDGVLQSLTAKGRNQRQAYREKIEQERNRPATPPYPRTEVPVTLMLQRNATA